MSGQAGRRSHTDGTFGKASARLCSFGSRGAVLLRARGRICAPASPSGEGAGAARTDDRGGRLRAHSKATPRGADTRPQTPKAGVVALRPLASGDRPEQRAPLQHRLRAYLDVVALADRAPAAPHAQGANLAAGPALRGANGHALSPSSRQSPGR